MDNIEINLRKAKTLTECARIIKGINYINGKIKTFIINYCFEKYNLDIIEQLLENNKNYCLNCGKEIEKGKKFCNSSCSATYNNKKRLMKKETKEKISNSLKKYYNTEDCIRTKSGRIKYKCSCETCKNTFYSKTKETRFCSQKCSSSNDDIKEKIKQSIEKRIENGTFSGWKSRNIKSYSEIFWESILFNNNINYIREDFSTKKYFLDFLIEKNGKKIDLEIDGKQHEIKERKEHDEERDKYLTDNGYIVYRVPWNDIKTEEGKLQMKEKIEKFLNFYITLI